MRERVEDMRALHAVLVTTLTGCAGLHPPMGMPVHEALEIAQTCREVDAIHYATPFDLFGVGLFTSTVRDITIEVQNSDCLKFYGFNREQ